MQVMQLDIFFFTGDSTYNQDGDGESLLYSASICVNIHIGLSVCRNLPGPSVSFFYQLYSNMLYLRVFL